MGPRPSGRGTMDKAFTDEQWKRSVNGAAAEWPRNARHALTREDRADVRQWGRGRVAAERSEVDLGPYALFASMGPRPSGRGTPWVDYLNSTIATRQWGRGRVAAERILRDICRVCWAGVNGAAAEWPRNERTLDGTGGGGARVNGAAAEWPRNAGGALFLCLPCHASMGPRPSGRGTVTAEHTKKDVEVRQWGRGRVAAER